MLSRTRSRKPIVRSEGGASPPVTRSENHESRRKSFSSAVGFRCAQSAARRPRRCLPPRSSQGSRRCARARRRAPAGRARNRRGAAGNGSRSTRGAGTRSSRSAARRLASAASFGIEDPIREDRNVAASLEANDGRVPEEVVIAGERRERFTHRGRERREVAGQPVRPERTHLTQVRPETIVARGAARGFDQRDEVPGAASDSRERRDPRA